MSGEVHNGCVHPNERILRGALIALPICAAPLVPSIVLGIHAAFVAFLVLTILPGGFVAAFYGIWIIGFFLEGTSAELIGDSALSNPPVYWPWGRYQRRIRFNRRIRYLERCAGITDPRPLDEP